MYSRLATIVVVILGLTTQLFGQTTSTATVKVPASTATGIGLATAADYQVKHNHQWEDYENVMVLATLNGAAKMAANTGKPMSTSDYLTLANQARNWLDQQKPDKQTFLTKDQAGMLRYGTDVLMSMVGVAPDVGPVLSATVGGFAKFKIDQLESTLDPSRQAAADQEFYDLAIRSSRIVSGFVREDNDLAQADPNLAAAVNSILHKWLGCDTTCSYDDIRALYPSVPAMQTNRDKSITVDSKKAETQADGVINDARSATEDDIADLQSVSDYQLSQTDPSNPTSPLPPGNTDNPALRQQQRQLKLDAAQATIGALSALIGLSDPRLANQIQTVGGATIQVGESISKYLNEVETLGSSATGLASAALTGNIIQAAVGIFSLFNSSGPSPDEVILQEIQKLSQQIENLHRDMDQRFDRVDSALNDILGTLNRNFAQIDYQLGVVSGSVASIQAGLLDIQDQINRLEQYQLAWTSAVSKEQLIQTMNGCLGYWVRTGVDIGFSQYQTCENAFYTWATNSSLDELWAGLQNPNYSDSNIYDTLSNFPLSVDTNYLAQFPSKNLGLSLLSNQRLPNPNEWALGVRAYLQLATEWPQYASQINSSRLDNLIAVGTAYDQAAQNANRIRNGNSISANQPLFKAIANKYSNAISSLQNALQDVVKTYVSDPAKNLNLWGGTSQTISYVPSATQIGSWCDGTAVPSGLVVPSANMFVDRYISPQYRAFVMAEYLGFGKIDYCLDVNISPTTNFPGWSYASHFFISARFNGKAFIKWSTSFPNWYFQSNQTISYFHDNIVRMWSGSCGVRSDFELAPTPCWGGPGAPPPTSTGPLVSERPSGSDQLLQDTINQVGSKLGEFQRALYKQIAGFFSLATPTKNAGQTLTATKLLVHAYVNFGLPTSLQTNDVLHSLLYGNQGIPDAPAVQSDFLGFSMSSIPDTTDNKITVEFALINNRLSTLTGTITGVLNQIQQSQTAESLPMVGIALADLQSFEGVKNAGALPTCVYQLSTNSAVANPMGDTIIIGVQVPNGCPWRVTSTASWLSAASSQTGSGQAKVNLSVSFNASGSSRVAIVTIGDQVLRIFQDASTSPPPLPVITAINPPSGLQGKTLTATVKGTNLDGATAVTFSGSGVTATIGSGGTGTSVPITIFIDTDAVTAARTITVTTPFGASTPPFNSFTVTARPAITGITPLSGTAGSTVAATISGTGLTGVTGVLFSGTGVMAVIAAGGSDTILPITITILGTADQTPRTVTVITPQGNSDAFNSFTVTPTTVTPTISSLDEGGLSPAIAPWYGGRFRLTVNGTNFDSAAAVSVGAMKLSTTQVSAAQLTAQVTADALRTIGAQAVKVTNSSGTVSNTVQLKTIERGDLNANRSVNIGDALVCALTVGGINKPPLANSVGDINLSGSANIGDCLLIALFAGRVNANFSVPVITSVSPSSAVPNSPLTITGTGFSANAGDNEVAFTTISGEATRVTPSAATPTSLTLTVPNDAVGGPTRAYRLDTPLAGAEYAAPALGAPGTLALTGVDPYYQTAVGGSVTLTGTGFDATPANNTVLFKSATGTVSGTVTAATTTSLTVAVPVGAVCGPVAVAVGGQTSHARMVTISGTPCGLQLVGLWGGGAPGDVVVLEGAGFDVVTPANNIVQFTTSGGGAAAAPVLAAGGTQLHVRIPDGVAPGNVTVTVATTTSNPIPYTPPSAMVPSSIDVVVNSANAVGSFQLTVGYNPSIVHLDAANVKGGTGAGFTATPATVRIDNAAGNVTLNAFQTANAPTGTFTVAHLVFTPIAVGTSNLTLSGVTLTDTAGNDLPANRIALSSNSITVVRVP